MCGTEGRAGMAVIQGAATALQPGQLFTKLSDKLPTYARPMFVRFVKELSKTGEFAPSCWQGIKWLSCLAGTQKLIKRNFQVEGFNIEQIQDEVFILDTKNKSYKILDKEMYSNIKNGNVRF